MSTVNDGVIAPDVPAMLRSQTYLRSVIRPESATRRLFLGDLQPLKTPKRPTHLAFTAQDFDDLDSTRTARASIRTVMAILKPRLLATQSQTVAPHYAFSSDDDVLGKDIFSSPGSASEKGRVVTKRSTRVTMLRCGLDRVIDISKLRVCNKS